MVVPLLRVMFPQQGWTGSGRGLSLPLLDRTLRLDKEKEAENDYNISKKVKSS